MKSHELTVHYWRVVFVIWLVVLTIATHLPHDVISKDSTLDSPDKLLHFLCFGMLAFMCMCSELFRSKWLMWLALGLWVVVAPSPKSRRNKLGIKKANLVFAPP